MNFPETLTIRDDSVDQNQRYIRWDLHYKKVEKLREERNRAGIEARNPLLGKLQEADNENQALMQEMAELRIQLKALRNNAKRQAEKYYLLGRRHALMEIANQVDTATKRQVNTEVIHESSN